MKTLERHGNQALLQVDMRGGRRLVVEVTFGGPSQDWSFNLGDSPSNNGWGGDGGDFSNDAELEIVNGKLDVFGSDDLSGEAKILLRGRDLGIRPGRTVHFEIANGEVRADKDVHLKHPALFALDGQPDREGPVNYDLFIGVNRVVAGGRFGSGVAAVKVRLLPK